MIEIINAEMQTDNAGSRWICQVKLTRDGDIYNLLASAPPDTQYEGLGTYFETRENELIADEDNLTMVELDDLTIVILQILMDELNILREQAGLQPRAWKQLLRAIRNRRVI